MLCLITFTHYVGQVSQCYTINHNKCIVAIFTHALLDTTAITNIFVMDVDGVITRA